MKILTEQDFDSLTADTRLLHSDDRGPQVLQTTDDRIIKLFHAKKGLSSNTILPYALRFAFNARLLKARGFSAPVVGEIYRYPAIGGYVLTYKKLPGKSILETLASTPQPDDILENFAMLICRLHQAGVFFRALHLGNVLHNGAQNFSLIDIGFARFVNGPLSIPQRVSNFSTLLNHEEDFSNLEQHIILQFWHRYLITSMYPPTKQQKLSKKVAERCPRYQELLTKPLA